MSSAKRSARISEIYHTHQLRQHPQVPLGYSRKTGGREKYGMDFQISPRESTANTNKAIRAVQRAYIAAPASPIREPSLSPKRLQTMYLDQEPSDDGKT